MSNVINKEQCPACASHGRDNSHDNLAVYDDGHKYCFACEHYEHGDNKEKVMITQPNSPSLGFVTGTIKSIADRKINDKTTRLYNYQSYDKDGKRLEISNYYRDGQVVAQKIRGAGKVFQWRGDSAKPELFGQHLWKNKGGKKVVVTEGEYDCMSVSFKITSGLA